MPGGDSVNGPFQDGWIRLVGVLLPVVALQLDMRWFDEPLQITVSKEGLISVIRGYLGDPVFDSTAVETDKLYVLPLHCNDRVYPETVLNFLIVQENKRMIDGTTTMSRVGIVSSFVEPNRETLPRGKMESINSWYDRLNGQASEVS